jgi:hypothetical protein
MSQSVKERAAELGERGATTVDSGVPYLPGEPVTVLVRKRATATSTLIRTPAVGSGAAALRRGCRVSLLGDALSGRLVDGR